MTNADIQAFQRLGDILDILRKQCPWDKVQTMESLRYLTIEETFELSEAILQLNKDDDSPLELKKELGDLFMHLLFYSKIAEEQQKGASQSSKGFPPVCPLLSKPCACKRKPPA